MRRLRIGVNALYLLPGQVGGTEIYLRNLLGALAEIDSENDYFLFTNRETGTNLSPPGANFQILEQPLRAAFRPARIFWEQTVLPVQVAAARIDVLLNPGFTGPLICGCPQVTVFHDLQHKRHPEHFRWFDLPFWRFFLYWAAHLSRIVLADSAVTSRDLTAFYRLSAQKIRVVPLGVEPKFFAIAAVRRPEPFLLTVSTLHPHKNLDRLLRAFGVFHRTHPEFRLVVTGLRGFHTAQLECLRKDLGLAGSVDFPGWIPREDLYDLFARAWAFVYPSTFEGFGLPVLESLAAGVPTACSGIEPLASMASSAALQFDPANDDELLRTLEQLASDGELRERLARDGPARAAQFSWRATGESTLAALREAATSSI